MWVQTGSVASHSINTMHDLVKGSGKPQRTTKGRGRPDDTMKAFSSSDIPEKSFSKDEILLQANIAITEYLKAQYEQKRITEEIYQKALNNTFKNLKFWIENPDIERLSPGTAQSIMEAIQQKRWKNIVEAFRQEITFGTAGIRGKAALTYEELLVLKEQGPRALILKGPNTINDVTLIQKTAGLIKAMKKNGEHRVIIGYDSRINGQEYAEMIARMFIGAMNATGYEFFVFLFDEASPFPELTFGITTDIVQADKGILISASHNPADYNGYKITRGNGAQLNQKVKNEVLAGVAQVKFENIHLADSLGDAKEGHLIWLGGKEPLDGKDYLGYELRDMHSLYSQQLASFFIRPEIVQQYGDDVHIGFAAFNGSGYKAVPRILEETGFSNYQTISTLQRLDGLFPAFKHGEQPDPGDPIAADIAIKEFIQEHGQEAFDSLDLLIGTDPDADRMGAVVKVPESQHKFFGSYRLLSANDAWTLLLWYRLMSKKEKGFLQDPQNHYVSFSHVTTDALEAVANLFHMRSLGQMLDKDGLEDRGGYLGREKGHVIKGKEFGRRTWVGFTYIADDADMFRAMGLVNEMGAEESNGMSILGGEITEGNILGRGAHVNDKDGTLAAVLMAEVAAYARSRGTTLFELLDHIYREIGHYATANKPLPRVGSFEGAEGVTEKIKLLKKAQNDWMLLANDASREFTISGRKVIGAVEFKSGRYDDQHYPGFPDEGIRFFFEDTQLGPHDDFTQSKNFITIRPSGTSQTLRFYVQIFSHVTEQGEALALQKYQNYYEAEAIALEAQKQLLEDSDLEKYISMVETQIKILAESHNQVHGSTPDSAKDHAMVVSKSIEEFSSQVFAFIDALNLQSVTGEAVDAFDFSKRCPLDFENFHFIFERGQILDKKTWVKVRSLEDGFSFQIEVEADIDFVIRIQEKDGKLLVKFFTDYDQRAIEAARKKLLLSNFLSLPKSPDTDSAMTADKGGIDLSQSQMDLQIRRDTSGIALPVSQQDIENIHIEGFIPVIINIQPVTNLLYLLGLTDEEGNIDSAYEYMDTDSPFVIYFKEYRQTKSSASLQMSYRLQEDLF